MNILFSEGSSTSARQSLSALGPLGYTIDICDPQCLGLGRFSRYRRDWLRCPSFAKSPAAYLDFLIDRLRLQPYDALLVVHDQVLLISRYRETLRRLVGLAVPDFEAVRMLQSKVQFAELLDQLNLPQPAYCIFETAADLEKHQAYPCYVKLEFGTAGQGVWLVQSPREMRELSRRLAGGGQHRFLVQQPAVGAYCVVQAVFQHGRMVGSHCYALRARGVGGSAHARLSACHPEAVADFSVLGQALSWHGAMHMEYFLEASTNRRQYLEANPRIGETLNATWSGTNLCDLLVQVSLGHTISPQPPSRPGVRTHSLLMSLLGAAERGGHRRELVYELLRAWKSEGTFSDSRDELTQLDEDPASLIPLVAVAARLLYQPALARSIIHGAVDNYSLGENAFRRVMELPADYGINRFREIMDQLSIGS